MIVEYTIDKNGTTIHKLWRDEATHKRNEEIVRDYTPYFFIESPQESKYHTLEGIPVGKKYAQYPFDIKEMKEMYKHYEADLSHTDKYVLDNMSLPLGHDYLRTIYLDIETYTHAGEPFPDQEEAPHRICLICLYDTVTEKYYTFDNDDEYELLMDFADFVRDADPDVLTAYNSDFDFATIYNRMTKLFIDPKILSRFNYTRYDPRFGVSISGIDLLDLLVLYKRLHAGELESFALNSVGEYELGIKKIDTGNDLPGDMIDKGLKKELEEYCLRDVELMVKLDEKMKIIEFYHLLQRTAGLSSIGAAVSNSRIHDMLILRKAHARNIILPSKEVREKTEVVGARVLDPVPGLHTDVAVLDVVGLYSNIFLTTNAGYETVSRTPRNDSVLIKTDNHSLYVDQSNKSLWCEVLEDLIDERMKHKKAMQAATVDTDEYEFHHTNQFAIKTLIASAYGVSNFRNFRLYSSDVSDIITFMGREMNKWMQGIVEKEGYTCVGGDTDSLFVSMGSPSVSVAINLADIVNNTWLDMLANMGISLDSHSFELEFDAMYSRFFSVSAKKRYAGKYSFKNGEVADGVKIVGFQFKRSDTTKLTKKLQETVFDIILTSPVEDVSKDVKSEIKRAIIELPTTNTYDIGIPHGFKKDPEDYGIQTIYTKGAIYSQKHLGMGGCNMVKPLFYSIKRVKPDSDFPHTESIGIDPSISNQMEILKTNFDIDLKAIEEKIIRKPMELILEALDTDYDEIVTGTKQKSLFDF